MKKIRNFLVPHEENGRVPHIFSEKVIIGLIVFVVLIYGTSVVSTLSVRVKDQLGAIYASVLVDMTNEARSNTDLPKLVASPLLTDIANRKASDMVNNYYFAHTSPTGISPWYWFREAGYDFAYAGENLAVGFSESEQVHTGWMNSPTHKANIVSANFSEIGIAVADGFYKGRPAIFVVQMFGKPKIKKSPLVLPTVENLNSNSNVTIEEKNESIENKIQSQNANVLSATQEEVTTPVITTVFEDKYLAIVKDETPQDIFIDEPNNTYLDSNVESINNVSPQQISTLKDRILVSQPLLVQYIFTIIMILTFFSLVIFLFFELKSKNMKHALYGIVLLAITAGLSISNQTMIVLPRLFY